MGSLRPLKETVVSGRVKNPKPERINSQIMLSCPKQYIYGQKVRPKSAPSTTKQDDEHLGDFKMGVAQINFF